jgi:hypothetical protein
MVIKSCPLLMKDTETCVVSSLASYFVLLSFYFVFISLISFRLVSFSLISFRFYFVSHFICTLGFNHQEGRVRIPLTGLTQPHICACPKPGPGFQTTYVQRVEVRSLFILLILVELLTITI